MTIDFKDDDLSCLCRPDGDNCPSGEAPARDRAIFDAAGRWIARLPSATEAEQVAFEAWLGESERHRSAWARVRYLWRLAGRALAPGDQVGRAGDTERRARGGPRGDPAPRSGN